jgi:hypothetical protein
MNFLSISKSDISKLDKKKINHTLHEKLDYKFQNQILIQILPQIQKSRISELKTQLEQKSQKFKHIFFKTST